MTAMQKTPHLDECVPGSFFGALLTALQLGLEPNTPLGHCYLIPRFNKKQSVYICSFEMGYQGMLELAHRTRLYHHISARVVYEEDDFVFHYGTGQELYHLPKWESETPKHVYAIYKLNNGGEEFTVWNWGAVLKHAEEFSESYNSNFSPWKASQASAEEMAKKTVLKALLKYGPKSVELASEIVEAVNSDGNTIIARKVEQGGESTVQFEIDYPPAIESPDESMMPPRQKAPAAEKAEKAAAERTPDPVPAKAAAPQAQGRKGVAALFLQDEDADLEERYQRSRGSNLEG
jgi:recombination protein RecT